MAKKKVTKKRTATKKKVSSKKESRPKTDKILIDNFVSMQKVLVHLTEKFSDLTKKIDNLLDLFEDAAKTVVDKEFHPIDEKSKRELNMKIDSILEQNKLIAKGLTLMHDSVHESKSPGQMVQRAVEEEKDMKPSKPQMQKKPLVHEQEKDPFKFP